MEYRRLNLTLLSAEGIKTLKNFFSKMDAYADVSLAGYPLSRHTTPVDHNCGGKPSWNSAMEFVVDESYLTQPGLSLNFEIRAENALGNDKIVGVVTVPIHELFQAAADPSVDTPAEYQLTTSSGKPKGIVKISYRFGEKFTKEHGDEGAVTAYPPAGTSGYGNEEKKDKDKKKNKKKKKKKKKKKSGMEKLTHGLAQGVGFIGGLVVGELIGAELQAEEEEEEEGSGSSD